MRLEVIGDLNDGDAVSYCLLSAAEYNQDSNGT